jgi:hypothetical protein
MITRVSLDLVVPDDCRVRKHCAAEAASDPLVAEHLFSVKD